MLLGRQVPLPILYKEVELDCGYRLDFVVGKLVVVEFKAIEKIGAHPRSTAIDIFEAIKPLAWSGHQF